MKSNIYSGPAEGLPRPKVPNFREVYMLHTILRQATKSENQLERVGGICGIQFYINPLKMRNHREEWGACVAYNFT